MAVTTFEPLTLSPKQAAEYSGLSLRTIYRLLADAAITARCTPGGGRTLIDGKSLRAYVASLPEYVPGASIVNAPKPKTKRKRAHR